MCEEVLGTIVGTERMEGTIFVFLIATGVEGKGETEMNLWESSFPSDRVRLLVSERMKSYVVLKSKMVSLSYLCPVMKIVAARTKIIS